MPWNWTRARSTHSKPFHQSRRGGVADAVVFEMFPPQLSEPPLHPYEQKKRGQLISNRTDRDEADKRSSLEKAGRAAVAFIKHRQGKVKEKKVEGEEEEEEDGALAC